MRHHTSRVWLWLLVAVALAAALYAAGGLREYHGTLDATAEIAESRAMLDALERTQPVDLNAEVERQRKAQLDARGGIMVDDLAAEQQKIAAMTTWNKADFPRWFEGTAIVGDSITKQLRGYGWLDEPVIAKSGMHISLDNTIWDEVEAASPSIIFLCCGMNDLGIFRDNVTRFADRYCMVIERLHESLPDALIYVHAILPVTAATVAREDKYQYIDLYNDTMKARCPQVDAYFIDSAFLMDAHPELFSRDGVHPKKDFYPLWLTYIADLTGLSNDEQ